MGLNLLDKVAQMLIARHKTIGQSHHFSARNILQFYVTLAFLAHWLRIAVQKYFSLFILVLLGSLSGHTC
jgi:hypothetical protein